MADRQKKLQAAEQHMNVGKSLSWEKEDFASAELELRKALQIYESIHGTMHDDTSRCYYELARALHGQKKFNASITMYRKALRLRVTQYGKFHTDVKNVDHALRVCCTSKGLFTSREINEAMDAFYQVLNHEVNGDTFRKAGRNAEAQVEYLKAVAIEEYYFGRASETLGELNRKAGIKAPPPGR
jgi:tetratricopeptide (TPR) repeat protein